MSFGLMEMQVVALIGLLAIASLAAWSSATLWRRQRKLEELVSELAASLGQRERENWLPVPTKERTSSPVSPIWWPR
jgi:type II secretory pathway pseudopilin PulG